MFAKKSMTNMNNLLIKFDGKICKLEDLPVGTTDYLDITESEHFIKSGCENSEYGNIFLGTDKFGRKYLAFKLNVKEYQENEKVNEYDCIYTVFERYTNNTEFICIANSHKMYDKNSNFANDILEVYGTQLYYDRGWEKINDMVTSFSKKEVWKVSGYSSSTEMKNKYSEYTVSCF